MTVTRLWLIRHGEPAPDIRGRCYGRLDVSLSAEGRQEVELVARRLASEPISAIYASPRRRTLESAEIIATRHGCGIQTENNLCEIDFGDFEGRTYDEISQRYPEVYRQWMERPTEVEFPHGESYSKLHARVTQTLAVLLERHSGQSVILATHGGVIRIVLAEVLSIPPANVFRIAQGYAAINLVQYIGSHPVVELVNEVPKPPLVARIESGRFGRFRLR
jgi:alpha-ribazole phosphatase/probable phosphoglycerate mutase